MTAEIQESLNNAHQETRPGFRPGFILFMCGMILCAIGVLLSIFWKLSFSSDPGDISFVITTIGLGIPIVLLGINTILRPNLEDKISFIGFVISIIFIISFMISYPNGWNYPGLYVIYLPYLIGIYLLTVKIFFNADNLIKEKEQTIEKMLRENDEILKEEVIQDYITEFTDKLKKDIDAGTGELSKRTILAIHKHVSEKEQFKKDIDSFIERSKKEKDELKISANKKIIESLMRPISSIEDTLKRCKNDKDMSMVSIVEKIKRDMYEILDNQGVEIINPSVGGDFDSSIHCAIDTIKTDKFADNKIIGIIEIGCRFKSGKPIKDAKVIVSENKQPSAQSSTQLKEQLDEKDKQSKSVPIPEGKPIPSENRSEDNKDDK